MRSRLRPRMVVVMAMALAAGCSAVGELGELGGSQSSEIHQELRLTAKDVGTFDLIDGGVCGAGFFEVRSHATGTGTVIGLYGWETVECFDGAAGVFSGTFTITTADGNSLSGEYDGVITGFIDANTASYEQDATITGGTGRFTGASGSFHGLGRANLATLEQQQSHSGTISNPGG